MLRFGCVSFVLVGFALLSLPATSSDETPSDDNAKTAQPAEVAKARLKFMIDSLGTFTVEVQEADGEKRQSKLQPAALRWSNNVSGTRDGIAGVWASNGRPDVVVQFAGFAANWNFHFETTSLSPLTMSRGEAQVWSPGAGIALKRFPNAPAPASTAAKRMVQLRELAERFEITDDFHPKYVEDKTERHVLRLLTKPLYRYEATGDLIDGALFGYVIATDPEALLMIEASKTDGKTEWRYAIKPMTVYQLIAKLDGQEVWNSPDNRYRAWKREEGCYLGTY
jgi:hypothetical protein